MKAILTKDISQLAKLIQRKEISPVELVTGFLKRIERTDSLLNTYITIPYEKVLAEARAKEAEIEKGDYRGPLHGIPIGIKDNIFTKQLKTTMGSEIYNDFIPENDAFVIEKLKKAGAIIIGKHNTHQFAYGPTGDRSHVGPVKNPYDTSKMTGGSSSGSAAAVAAYLCAGAIGTDTGGSVRIPASFCGIVGMKPTFGRVSQRGVHPLSWHLDHVGPMSKTVTDNALLLNAIVSYDPFDEKSVNRNTEDFTRLIGKDIRDKKIGIPRPFYYEGVEAEIIVAVENVMKLLEEQGAHCENVNLPYLDEILEAQRVIIRCDAYAIHEENLKKHPDLWDDEVKERLYTGVYPKGFEYAKAIHYKEFAKQEFHRVLQDVDVLITPTMSIMPPKVGGRYTSEGNNDENHIRWTITKLTSPTNLNGLPSLTVPCGFSETGLPIGVQLIGKEFDEATLYQFGYVIEQALALHTGKWEIK